jgi:phospholipase C
MASTSPIKHVVIIVKENHGYDNSHQRTNGRSR